jgi:hypothetical protein
VTFSFEVFARAEARALASPARLQRVVDALTGESVSGSPTRSRFMAFREFWS